MNIGVFWKNNLLFSNYLHDKVRETEGAIETFLNQALVEWKICPTYTAELVIISDDNYCLVTLNVGLTPEETKYLIESIKELSIPKGFLDIPIILETTLNQAFANFFEENRTPLRGRMISYSINNLEELVISFKI